MLQKHEPPTSTSHGRGFDYAFASRFLANHGQSLRYVDRAGRKADGTERQTPPNGTGSQQLNEVQDPQP